MTPPRHGPHFFQSARAAASPDTNGRAGADRRVRPIRPARAPLNGAGSSFPTSLRSSPAAPRGPSHRCPPPILTRLARPSPARDRPSGLAAPLCSPLRPIRPTHTDLMIGEIGVGRHVLDGRHVALDTAFRSIDRASAPGVCPRAAWPGRSIARRPVASASFASPWQARHRDS